MKRLNRLYILLYLLPILPLYGCYPMAQVLSHDDLIRDLNYLNNAINEGHPIILNKAWTNELQPFIKKLKNQPFDKLSAFEYEYVIREALSIVGCAHTIITESPLSELYKKQVGENKYLPIRFFADSSGLYAIESSLEINGSTLNFPIKIYSINNLSAKEIIDKLANYQAVDGHQKTMGFAIINKYSEILIRQLFIGTDEFSVKYHRDDGTLGEWKVNAVMNYDRETSNHSAFQLPKAPIESTINLYKIEPNSVFLEMKTMSYNNYKKSHAAVFEYIITNEIQNLIIDLRGNGGGQPKISLDFLSYILSDTLAQMDIRPKGNVHKHLKSKLKLLGVWLWDKVTKHEQTDSGIIYITNVTLPQPTRFTNNLFILTDGFTASSASTLASYLKFKAGAVSIGQETAGGETGCNANSFQTLELPASKIKINFPLFRFKYPLAVLENHHGIIPDFKIQYDAETALLNKDLELEKAFELIK